MIETIVPFDATFQIVLILDAKLEDVAQIVELKAHHFISVFGLHAPFAESLAKSCNFVSFFQKVRSIRNQHANLNNQSTHII